MSEYDKAVIQFNSLQIIDCATGKGLSDAWHETFASFGKNPDPLDNDLSLESRGSNFDNT